MKALGIKVFMEEVPHALLQMIVMGLSYQIKTCQGDEGIEHPRRDEAKGRRMQISKKMLEKYVYTEDCEGCSRQRAGIDNHRKHSEVCRKRIMEALEGDEEGRRKREQDERK